VSGDHGLVPSVATPPDDVVHAALAEFALGAVHDVHALTPSGSAFRVKTGQGQFVLKVAYRERDVRLQAEVASLLPHRGIRQPQVVATQAGGLVTSNGYFLQELLPGAALSAPTDVQIAVAMRHVAAYHRELGELPLSYEPEAGSLWQRVADVDFLLESLPSLLARFGLGGEDVDAALARLAAARLRSRALPRQVVHGDIGPDNILMSGNEVVALIDFTPFWESVLFAACTALYWYHVHGVGSVTAGTLRSSVAEMNAERSWTSEELTLWPPGLVREALRRLATPLELARESGTEPGPAVERRRAAVATLVEALPQLSS